MSTTLNQIDETANDLRNQAFARMGEMGVREEFKPLVWADFLRDFGRSEWTRILSEMRWSHKAFFTYYKGA